MAARALAVAKPDSHDPVAALTAAYDAEVERLREAIGAKDRNIKELEKWARGMERELHGRDAAARAAARAAANTLLARTQVPLQPPRPDEIESSPVHTRGPGAPFRYNCAGRSTPPDRTHGKHQSSRTRRISCPPR